MSGSLASAKAKRAGINPPPPNAPPRPPQQQSQPPPQGGVRMTIPQVLAMFDSRLSKLEAGAKNPVPVDRTDTLDEMEAKFMMLAEEITTMKDVIMKLQSFTMDVNKTLFDERIHIMSDMNGPIKSETIEEQPDSIQIKMLDNSVENII